jgi:hypothetical protein
MKPLLKASFLALLSISLALSACGPKKKSVSSEENAPFIYTSTAQTAAVHVPLTSTALPVNPNDTLEPESVNTATVPPTSTTFVESTAAPGADTCDNSSFVTDVTFPDNSVVAPATTFDKTWSVENNGTCTWNDNYSLTFTSGDQMFGATAPVSGTVAPGDTTDITVPMVSPNEDGTYTGYWQLMNDHGQLFGVVVYVLIQVSSSVTSTPTSMGGNTPNPTPIFTDTGTDSPTPTSPITIITNP